MNTITKSAILAADKLATLYAGELRGKGYTPSMTPAVTSEKVMRCEFQNGSLNKIALPIGRLADWARTFEGETEFDIEFCKSDDSRDKQCRMVVIHGGSRIAFLDLATERTGAPNTSKEIAALSEVPPLRFDDDKGKRRAYELVIPTETGNIAAKLKSNKAAAQLAKLRQKEIAAKKALKLAASKHGKNIAASPADGLPAAVTRAAHLVRSFRLLRRAIAAPMDIIPWLGETIAPRGEYDAGDVKHFTPEHFDCMSAVLTAKADCKAFADKRPGNIGGPKHQALAGKVTSANAALLDFIIKAWRKEMNQNGFDVFVYMSSGKLEVCNYSGELMSYSRARIAVRQWPVKKFGLAQTYTDALDARRKFEIKAIEAGNLVAAKTTHADGTVKTGSVTPQKFAELQTVAIEKGAKLEVVFATGQAAESVSVRAAGFRIEHHPTTSQLCGTEIRDWYLLLENQTLRAAGSLIHCESWRARIETNRAAGMPDRNLPAMETRLPSYAGADI